MRSVVTCVVTSAPYCRLVASGDALVTGVTDTVQVVVLVLSCIKFNEPFFQLGVRGAR